jgi:hypothetical protein
MLGLVVRDHELDDRIHSLRLLRYEVIDHLLEHPVQDGLGAQPVDHRPDLLVARPVHHLGEFLGADVRPLSSGTGLSSTIGAAGPAGTIEIRRR